MMDLFEVSKQKGFVTVYTDTPPEVEEKIRVYNTKMMGLRQKKAILRKYRTALFIMNVLLVVTLFFLCRAQGLFEVSKYDIKKLLVGGLVRGLTAGFFAVAVFDVLLFFLHRRLRDQLKIQEGYPSFTDINIKYSYEKTPNY